MNSKKNIVILVLAVTTVGGALLAWRQYAELVELRAAAMNRDERADWQKRIWDLEKRNRELQDRLAALGFGRSETDAALADAGGESRPDASGRGERRGRGGDFRGRGGFEQQANAIRELMNKPEVQAMVSVQQKAAIDARYAALFKNLNLSAERADKLKTLLAERSTTIMDVMSAARDQGVNPRENPEAFRKLVADAQDAVNASIKSVLGETGYAQLQTYEQTMPQRNLVSELQQRLSYSNAPLSSAQAEQLVQILAANAPQRTASTESSHPTSPPPLEGRGPPPMGGREMGFMLGAMGGGGPGGMLIGGIEGGRGGGAVVTPAAVAQAQSVLEPTQLAALQQIQQQQQTHQQLQQLVRETLVASQPAANPASSGAAAPAGGSNTGTAPVRKRPGGG